MIRVWTEDLEAACKRIGRERFLSAPPADAEVVSCADLLRDRERLLSAITLAGSFDDGPPPPDQDIRGSASRWTRRYGSSLVTPVLVALAEGVGVDASLANVSVVLTRGMPSASTFDAGETVTCRERDTSWRVEGSRLATLDMLRAFALRRLFDENLRPMFAAVRAIAKLSERVHWSNVAESVDLLYVDAEARLDAASFATYGEDRALFPEAPTLPGVAGPNPLRGLIRHEPVAEPDFPMPLQVREVCCACYLMPNRPQKYCRNCPLLPTQELVEKIRIYRLAR